jgi:protein-disulfide isomerase
VNRFRSAKSRYASVLVVAAAVTAVLIGASQLGARDKATTTTSAQPAASEPSLFAGIPQQGAALGSPTARLTLIEYADLQCPYCARWARDTLPTIVADYVKPGKLRIVFSGMTFVGADSRTALSTAIAAGRQHHFWDVVHGLFLAQGAENSGWVTDGLITEIASGVPGLDASRLIDARSASWVDAALTRATSAAQAAGVNSTPSFRLGLTGGPFDVVQVDSLEPEGITPAIDAALAG